MTMKASGRAAALASAAALSCALSGPSLADDTCIPVKFDPGSTSAVVSGAVPPENRADPAPIPACYTIAVGEGQRARVRLLSGENVAITVPGVSDMSEAIDFTTRRGTYRLELFQLFPAPAEAPFEMRVEVLP